ncbi:MAG: BatA domain-containing protein, partial [Candidatus Woesearchaeota archaeon]|nr:BatA domain-containing protein [Candidatus Woesearchaeota archaeon]
MPLSLGSVVFGLPAGLWALLGLVPLIALYLIRPKPKQLQVPSLMFFFHNTGRSRLTNFLKQITRDWLFVLQLLLLLLLALANAQPSTTVQHDITAQNTVLVIDVSASSQVREGLQSRFDIGISKAKKV